MIRPLNKKILVLDEPDKLRSTGGIHLTRQWEHPSGTARVISVSEGTVDLKPGDRVLTRPYAGKEVERDGKKYRLLEASEIIGIEL